MNYGRYWVISAAAASAVLYHAFATRQHFYPTALYLSTSKLAVAVVGNLAFASALLLHQLLIKIFLGSLRDIEQELIRERLSSAIMESLLALTIFREEFSGFFVAMFAGLVFVKVLHWLVQDRVDYIEVTPSVSRLQHLRIVSFMSVLLVLDCAFLQYTVSATIASAGQSVMLLFAFEYVIQASDVIRYFVKYVMSMADLWLEGRWEGKGTCVFYLDLITDMLHLFVYVVFFIIVFTNYGLPLHLVRDLYSTFRNFRNRVVDFLRFRQVSARLDRLPDATADDLSRSDGVCIICREEMSATGSNKKLFCGHVFHTHCLRSWLERQQNCPTCRGAVFQRRADGSRAAAAVAAAAAAGAAPAQQQQQAAAAAAPDAAAGAAPRAGAADAGAGAGVPAAAGAAAARGPQAAPHAHHHHPHVFHVPVHHGHNVRLRHHAAPAAARAAARAPDQAAAAAAAPVPNPFVQLAGLPVPPPQYQGNVDALLEHHLRQALAGTAAAAGPAGAGGAAFGLGGLGGAFPFGGLHHPGSLLGGAPLWPTLMPPLTPAPAANSMIEQQAAAAAAAAALAAAAAVGAYNPLGSLVWLPSPQGGASTSASVPAATTAGGGSSGSGGSGSTAPAVPSAGAEGAAGASGGSGGSVEDELLSALGRVAGEVNHILEQVARLKQQALARQLADEMQAAMASAASTVAAAAAVAAAAGAAQPVADGEGAPGASSASASSTQEAPAAPAVPMPAAAEATGLSGGSAPAVGGVAAPAAAASATPIASQAPTVATEAVDTQEEVRRKRLARLEQQQQQ